MGGGKKNVPLLLNVSKAIWVSNRFRKEGGGLTNNLVYGVKVACCYFAADTNFLQPIRRHVEITISLNPNKSVAKLMYITSQFYTISSIYNCQCINLRPLACKHVLLHEIMTFTREKAVRWRYGIAGWKNPWIHISCYYPSFQFRCQEKLLIENWRSCFFHYYVAYATVSLDHAEARYLYKSDNWEKKRGKNLGGDLFFLNTFLVFLENLETLEKL